MKPSPLKNSTNRFATSQPLRFDGSKWHLTSMVQLIASSMMSKGKGPSEGNTQKGENPAKRTNEKTTEFSLPAGTHYSEKCTIILTISGQKRKNRNSEVTPPKSRSTFTSRTRKVEVDTKTQAKNPRQVTFLYLR